MDDHTLHRARALLQECEHVIANGTNRAGLLERIRMFLKDTEEDK